MTTIKAPSVTEARAAAKADSAAKEARKITETNEERTLLYGKVLVKIEDVMKNEDVEDIPILKSLLDVLNGTTTKKESKRVTRTWSWRTLLNNFKN